MSNEQLPIPGYFCSPESYFWQWAEGTAVIEWSDGGPTICYRDDLMAMLKALEPQGLPPLGAVLLILAACKDGQETFTISRERVFVVVRKLRQSIDMSMYESTGLFRKTEDFLQLVSSLPKEHRTGPGRIMLLQTIFEQAPCIPEKEARSMLKMFDSGELDTAVVSRQCTTIDMHFKADMAAFGPAINTYKTKDQFLQKLRTGLTYLPKELSIPPPDTAPADLLAQLAEDDRTAGVTRLTQRLMAALKIPMHAHGSSDQSFGGVSDITNRGNFDRLLLSELAHDDLSLMARLANNEALYLRREELPAKRNREWVILLDTTIRMWGTPRVFGVAAALACSRNSDAPESVQGYALSGNSFKAVDLMTKEGVISALEQQVPALHCGEALQSFMQELKTGNTVSFLVTSEESLTDIALVRAIREADNTPAFLITVNRNGQLHFYEYIKGRKRLISHAAFDLEELLFHRPGITATDGLPAALYHKPFPFSYPAVKIRFTADAALDTGINGVLCITEDQRLLYWSSHKSAAREVVPHMEGGGTFFGHSGDLSNDVHIFVHGPKNATLYNISLRSLSFSSITIPAFNRVDAAVFHSDRYFIVRTDRTEVALTVDEGLIKELPNVSPVMKAALDAPMILEPYKRNRIKKHINNGYSILNNINTLSVTAEGHLIIDIWQLAMDDDGRIKLREASSGMRTKDARKCRQENVFYPLPNKRIAFRRLRWDDGSEAIVDTRGFMHLKSADSSIPEISFVLVLEKYTALWAADGRSCGNDYFLDAPPTTNGKDFYKNYIQRFIDVLK